MEAVLQNIKVSLRNLRKTPLLSALALVCLALGIGATTAIFSVVNAVILRPLPVKDIDRVVMITSTHKMMGEEERVAVSPRDYAVAKAQAKLLESMGALENGSFNLTGDGDPERLEGARVTDDWLTTLGLEAVVGRLFLPEEDRTGAPARVALVGNGLWHRRYGADPGLVGRQIVIDGASYTVVGVLSARFQFPYQSEIWLPLGINPNAGSMQQHTLTAFGRLRPGVSPRQVQTELAGITRRLAQQYPENADIGVDVRSMREELTGDIRPKLLFLLATVAFVLLIACANIASLLLARAQAQTQEVAIRSAIGAGRHRLIRQFLIDSLVLSILGGGLGVLLSFWAIKPLVALSPVATMASFYQDVRIDGPVLAFAFVISILTGVSFGLAPAVKASRPDLQLLLSEASSRNSGSRGGHRALGLLVIVEVAVAVVLLVGAGLTLKSFDHLQKVDPGFSRDGVLTLRTILPESRYSDAHRRVAFVDSLLERVRSLPGVVSAGITSNLPVNINNDFAGFSVEGRPVRQPGEFQVANNRLITPGYLESLGISLVAGRSFTPADRAGVTQSVIISERLAKRYFSGLNPIGKRLKRGPQESSHAWMTVVGVANDVKDEKLRAECDITWYLPYPQFAEVTLWASNVNLAVRTRRDPVALAPALVRAVHEVDPTLPVFQVAPTGELLAESLAQKKFSAILVTIFAGIGLILAAVGLYGVMSYSVSQRVREIGVRMALGAHPGDVQKMVVRNGLKLTLAGMAAGLLGALALTRFLRSLLYEVSPTDPTTFIGILLILALVGFLATYLPARRATRVDPMIALRNE
jgi:putative ABC transport system permease protein